MRVCGREGSGLGLGLGKTTRSKEQGHVHGKDRGLIGSPHTWSVHIARLL